MRKILSQKCLRLCVVRDMAPSSSIKSSLSHHFELCVISVFACLWLLGLLMSEGAHRFFSFHNNPSTCCAQSGKTDHEESVQVLIQNS